MDIMTKAISTMQSLPELNGPYYPFIGVGNTTEITVSHNLGTKENPVNEVLIEEAFEGGFKTLRFTIPYMDIVYSEYMSHDEIVKHMKFIQHKLNDVIEFAEEMEEKNTYSV